MNKHLLNLFFLSTLFTATTCFGMNHKIKLRKPNWQKTTMFDNTIKKHNLTIAHDFAEKLDKAIQKEQRKKYTTAARAIVGGTAVFSTASYVASKTVELKNSSCDQTSSFISPQIILPVIGCAALIGTLIYHQWSQEKKQSPDDNDDLELLTKDSQKAIYTLQQQGNNLDGCKNDLHILATKLNRKKLSLNFLLQKISLQKNSPTICNQIKLEEPIKEDEAQPTHTSNLIVPSLFAGTSLMWSNFTTATKHQNTHRPLEAEVNSVAATALDILINKIAPSAVSAACLYFVYSEAKKLLSAEERANVVTLRQHIDDLFNQTDKKFVVCFNNFNRIDKEIKNLKDHIRTETATVQKLLQEQTKSQEKTQKELQEILAKLELAKKSYNKMAQELQNIVPKMSAISKNTKKLTEAVRPLHKIKDYELTVLQLQEQKPDNLSTNLDEKTGKKKKRFKLPSICTSSTKSVVNPKSPHDSEEEKEPEHKGL